MITANQPKQKKYGLAFTVKQFVPESFLLDKTKPVVTKGNINGKEQNIQLEDVQEMTFEGLQRIETTIKASTDLDVETLQKGLVQRYKEKIKQATIYVLLYKLV